MHLQWSITNICHMNRLWITSNLRDKSNLNEGGRCHLVSTELCTWNVPNRTCNVDPDTWSAYRMGRGVTTSHANTKVSSYNFWKLAMFWFEVLAIFTNKNHPGFLVFESKCLYTPYLLWKRLYLLPDGQLVGLHWTTKYPNDIHRPLCSKVQ